MPDRTDANAEQVRLWRDEAGPRWVAEQERADAMLAPFGLAAMEALAPREGERVLDVGAGCGDTALELARRVGPTGRVLAVDVSGAMLHRARERATAAGMRQIDFLVQDAQAARPGGPHDAAFSRFGIMFFDDPVLAFRRIGESLVGGGRLAACTWRSREENAWLSGPLRVVAQHVDVGPLPDPHAPGPFGLFDRPRTLDILRRAGWRDVRMDPFDAPVILGAGSTPEDAADYVVRLGPLGRVLADAPPAARASAMAALRDFFAPHATPTGVSMPAAAWILQAIVV